MYSVVIGMRLQRARLLHTITREIKQSCRTIKPMNIWNRFRDKMIERRVSHAAKILRKHRGYHKHTIND